MRKARGFEYPPGSGEAQVAADMAQELSADYASALAKHPALEDLTRLTGEVARRLHTLGAITDPAAALSLKERPLQRLLTQLGQAVGASPRTFPSEVLAAVVAERQSRWLK